MAKLKRKSSSHKSPPKLHRLLLTCSILIALVLGILLIKHFLIKSEPEIIFGYEECIASKTSTVYNTFPKQCKAANGTLWIEKISEPIDTSGWRNSNSISGITFKCPPGWTCSNQGLSTQYGGGSNDIAIQLINPANFQESQLRNPNYSNPVSWYLDLLAGKNSATIAPPSTRIYGAGTDGYSDPIYVNFDLSNTEDINLKVGTGKTIPFKSPFFGSAVRVLIPVSSTSLLFISLPSKLSPLTKTLLDTIQKN